MHSFKSIFALCTVAVFASNKSTDVLVLNCLVTVVGDLPLIIKSDNDKVAYTTTLSVPKQQVFVMTNKKISSARATVAMARNNVFNSTTSEFYVNLVDNTFLNYKTADIPSYAVFGKVVPSIDLLSTKRFKAESLQ